MDNPYQPPAIPPDHVEWDYDRRPKDRRPTAVTVFGILNIVFSSLALLCFPFAILYLFVPMAAFQGNPAFRGNPALQINQDPTYRMVTLALSVFGLVGAVVELASGIGLLRVRPWGRSLAFVFVSMTVLSAIASIVFAWTYTIPAINGLAPKGGAEAAGAAFGAMLGGTFGPLLSLIYPFVLFVFMLTPAVAQALERNRFPEDDSPTWTPF